MSQRALQLAVRDRIRLVLNLGVEPEVCDVTLKGRPHPAAGQQFVGIHANGWDGQRETGDYDLWESFGAKVTVTRRLPEAPEDRQAAEIWLKEEEGLSDVCRKIVVAIHKSYEVLAIANETYLGKIGADQWRGVFHEPLKLAGVTDPEIKGPEWFLARPTGRESGLIQIISFFGAVRGQDKTLEVE